MARQTGLGRGLETLMGSQISNERDVFAELDINLIDPNPNQPRRSFDSEKLDELAASIRSVGVISPILVVKNGERYMIVSGERRFRASKRAKLTHIPALIRDFDAMKRIEIALIENLQRADLNPMEEALGIKALMDECALTQEQAANQLGKSRSAIANTLRLLALDETTAQLVADGKLSEGHARALLGIADDEKRAALAQFAAENGLSVRQVEDQVRKLKLSEVAEEEIDNKSAKPPEFEAMESVFKQTFGSTVKISGTAQRGSIAIQYKSFEEFERIFDILNQGNQ